MSKYIDQEHTMYVIQRSQTIAKEKSGVYADSNETNWAIAGLTLASLIVSGITDDHTVEIVRCKDCKFYVNDGRCSRPYDWFEVDENDFCSLGERSD